MGQAELLGDKRVDLGDQITSEMPIDLFVIIVRSLSEIDAHNAKHSREKTFQGLGVVNPF